VRLEEDIPGQVKWELIVVKDPPYSAWHSRLAATMSSRVLRTYAGMVVMPARMPSTAGRGVAGGLGRR
jgi:hypothetical protein